MCHSTIRLPDSQSGSMMGNRLENALAYTRAIKRSVTRMFTSYGHALYQRSLAIPPFFNRRMGWIAGAWIIVAGSAAALRMAAPASPVHKLWDALPMLVLYSAIIIAPIAGYLIASSIFSGDRARHPLMFHFSFVGKWQRISPDQAKAHPLFGPAGFMASLLIGLILNVAVRSGEYFVAVPGMSMHTPDWAMTLFIFMSLDLIVMNFFYMIALVMALRNIPLFPRMMLLVWLTDIAMQLVITDQISRVGSLPVEVTAPLVTLLEGNLIKVAISIVIWMPYMLLSERVNVTYRSRIPV